LQGVRASLTFDDITAIAGVPDEHIVAGTTEQEVIAPTADERVIAVAADQDVVAVAADDRVIAGSAVDGEPDQTRQSIGTGERVVPTVHIDGQVLRGADVQEEGRG